MDEGGLVLRLPDKRPSHAQEEADLVPSTPGSAGIDLIAVDHYFNAELGYHEYGTGISVEIPPGYEAQIRPRSSIRKKDLVLINSPGTIDSDYRGEVKVTFNEINSEGHSPEIYAIGDRIAQIVVVPVPSVKFVEVKELSDTKRGSGGFGSTGV